MQEQHVRARARDHHSMRTIHMARVGPGMLAKFTLQKNNMTRNTNIICNKVHIMSKHNVIRYYCYKFVHYVLDLLTFTSMHHCTHQPLLIMLLHHHNNTRLPATESHRHRVITRTAQQLITLQTTCPIPTPLMDRSTNWCVEFRVSLIADEPTCPDNIHMHMATSQQHLLH